MSGPVHLCLRADSASIMQLQKPYELVMSQGTADSLPLHVCNWKAAMSSQLKQFIGVNCMIGIDKHFIDL